MCASNVKVFTGMSEIYDRARPSMPDKLLSVVKRYLGREVRCVVDVGCGTGKSLDMWLDQAQHIIGVEPNAELRAVAEKKYADRPEVCFFDDCGEKMSIPDNTADVITCVQVFHWLDDKQALPEFDRILKPGGMLLVCDFDFPPISLWEADRAYAELLQFQKEMDKKYPELNRDVFEGDKLLNLQKIAGSGYFDYCRNAVFIADELFDAKRYIDLAFSQSTLDRIARAKLPEAEEPIGRFKSAVCRAFGGKEYEIQFCMRMTLAVKK